MRSDREALFRLGLVGLTVALTLATAYIHYWVGGAMLMLNAIGYVGLAAAVVGAALVYRRALPIVLLALAGYAAVTILGWLVMGPYFDIAYLAKGIELALIATIALYLLAWRAETRASFEWGRAIATRALRVVLRRPAATPSTPGSDG